MKSRLEIHLKESGFVLVDAKGEKEDFPLKSFAGIDELECMLANENEIVLHDDGPEDLTL